MADLSRGIADFSEGEEITATKLHNLVDEATIDAGAVTTAKIADGAVTNAKIAAAAGVALSKIATTSGRLVGGSVGNTAEEVTVGATLTLASSTLGVTTAGIDTAQLADNSVTVAKLAATLDLSSNTVTLPDGVVGAAKLDQDFINAVTVVTPASGDYLIFGDADDSGNLKKATASALGFGALSASSEYVLSAGIIATIDHGLSSAPSRMRLVLVCQSGGDNGYSAGDEISVDTIVWLAGVNNVARTVIIASADADNIYLTVTDSFGNGIYFPHKSTGTASVATASQWKAKVYYGL